MASLQERFDELQRDLLARPPRIALMSNLPFAILRYEPDKEWELRKRARLLASRLEADGRHVHAISMADLMWRAVDETEGMDALVKLEQSRGFDLAQRQMNLFLSDPDFRPLPGSAVRTNTGARPAARYCVSHATCRVDSFDLSHVQVA